MPEPAAIASAIVAHYASVRRALPWRATRDPYAIWVSEIMLQQTRVATVIPYWQRWMARFPTASALAEAPLDDVLAAWAGLGYYSRARNLHAGARAVAERFGGALPARAAELRAVPGIGPYTAGAIASIAFGERAPLVDGNVARVLARVYAIDHDIKSSAGQRALWARAGELMAALPDGAAPGDLNQGLMELGATICAPAPRCPTCPLHAACATRGDARPVAAPRKRADQLPVLARAALWIADREELVLARRAPRGLYGGLWELPQGDDAAAIARALGASGVDRRPVAYHEQTLSHRRLRIEVFRAAMPARLGKLADPGYDALARVPIATARERGIAAATVAILTKYEDTPWSSIRKRSPSSPRASTRSSKASASSTTTSTTRTSPAPPSARPRRSTSSSTTRSR
ncbi:MAG TPA: A/G-specific adenine glycosylase [Kofleriaceae bacterium]|nr:A/G-specific adenine glycosylase [Kofleriaceae bacterium]